MPDGAPDPMARLAERAEQYAAMWRSAIERNAAGQYKPEDWLDDVNRAFVMAAEDAARTFAAVVDAVAVRQGATSPSSAPTPDAGSGDDAADQEGGGSADG